MEESEPHWNADIVPMRGMASSQKFSSGSYKEDKKQENTKQIAYGIARREHHGIFAELAAICQEPDAGDPEQQHGTGKPDHLRMPVERRHFLSIHEEGSTKKGREAA